MDKSEVLQNIKKRFVDFKERQQDTHISFMNRYAHMQTKEMQEVSLTRKFMNVPPNQNNKTSKQKQQFVNKQLGSTSSEQSNNSNLNGGVNGTSFTNGPIDMMQASQKRTYDQFSGASSDDSLAKIPRVADQNKFQSARNVTNTPFDVNSNQIQPNVNPFQTNIPKEKPNLSLPVTSMSMSKNSSISTPQVVKNVEELLEGNLNMQQQPNNNVKVKSEPSLASNAGSITTPVSNTQSTVAGFDDNLQYFGELIKNEIKTESGSSASTGNIAPKSSSLDSSITPAINTRQQQPQQQQHQQLLQQSQTPQLQKLQQQNVPQGTQKWQNILSTNITNVNNQQPINIMNQMLSRPTAMNMNTTQQNTTGMQMKAGNRLTNTNVGQPLVGVNAQHLNQHMPQQQQQNYQNSPNNTSSINSMNLSSVLNNSNNSTNNVSSMRNNMMNSNPSGNIMSGNVQQPPSLPRISSMSSPRVQLAHHVITKNPPMVPPVPNYMQNHIAPNTNEKMKEYLKLKRLNPKYSQSMPNQMMSSMQNGMPQNNFSYTNDMGFNNQGNIQPQQNPIGYYPYQMDGSNNPNIMFGNNPPGYYPNKQPNRMVQNLMGRQPMNGMYNPMGMSRQGMNQANIFNMNAKLPPQYTNQGMNSPMLNNQHTMMNPNMQTPNRLSHYQADTNNMGMPGPLGMNNQMGMRNPMNVGNQFPPPLARSIMQPNNDNNLMNNVGNNQFNFNNMNNQQQDTSSFSGMSQNNSNMNFNNNSMNEALLMQRRQKYLLLHQQKLQQRQLLSQQQKSANFPNSNFNTMNTDNNMQMIAHDNSGMNNNMNFSGNQNFMQQQQQNSLSNNTLQQNNLQQHTRLQQNPQQQSQPQEQVQRQQQEQQQSTLPPPQTLDNIGNISNSQDNLLSPNNTLHGNPLRMSSDVGNTSSSSIKADDDDFDTLLDNPPEQFDLINELGEGL